MFKTVSELLSTYFLSHGENIFVWQPCGCVSQCIYKSAARQSAGIRHSRWVRCVYISMATINPHLIASIVSFNFALTVRHCLLPIVLCCCWLEMVQETWTLYALQFLYTFITFHNIFSSILYCPIKLNLQITTVFLKQRFFSKFEINMLIEVNMYQWRTRKPPSS